MLANFHRGLKILGTKKANTVMVGDQLMTDILGANRVNINSILVVPVKEKDGWATYLNRRIERVIMKYFKRKNMITWEE
jgi:Predicted hydrolase of the HAD superfamily